MVFEKFRSRHLSGFLVLFVIAHFSHHLLPSLLIPLLPFIRNDLNLDYTQAGLLFSAFTLAYGIGQLPAGWLTDHIGPRKMIAISISGVALAGVLVGMSTTYLMMIVFLVAMGLTGGGYHPSAPPLISAAAGPQTRGLALGLHIIGGSSCFFLTPLIAAATAAALGWRGTFFSLALPTFFFGLILYRRLKSLSAAEKNKGPSGKIENGPSAGFSNFLPLAAFILLSVAAFAVVHSFMAFIPLYLVDHFAVEEKAAAAFLSVFYLAGFWAAPLGGYLSDRFGSVPLILAICFISGPVLYLVNIAPNMWALGALLLTLGTIHVMRYPISESYLIDQTPAKYRSTVLGIYFFSCTESGGVLAPVMGSLIDTYGFYFCFSAVAAFMLAVTLTCALLMRKSPPVPAAG